MAVLETDILREATRIFAAGDDELALRETLQQEADVRAQWKLEQDAVKAIIQGVSRFPGVVIPSRSFSNPTQNLQDRKSS